MFQIQYTWIFFLQMWDIISRRVLRTIENVGRDVITMCVCMGNYFVATLHRNSRVSIKLHTTFEQWCFTYSLLAGECLELSSMLVHIFYLLLYE